MRGGGEEKKIVFETQEGSWLILQLLANQASELHIHVS